MPSLYFDSFREEPDDYDILGISPSASPDEIKASYRRLQKIYHPDTAGPQGEAMSARCERA